MQLNLQKGMSLDLTKATTNLNNLYFGLAWDPVKSFFGTSPDIDLDASVIVLDANKNVLETIYFGNKTGYGIKHSGDNRTGAGSGDDEVILVDLTQVKSDAAHLVFTINNYTGQTLEKVDNASCRVLDNSSKNVLASITLNTKGSKNTAIVIGAVNKTSSGWEFKAISETTNGRTVHDLIPFVKSLI